MYYLEQHYYYNPQNRNFARKLRNSSTKAECCLWKYVLRASLLEDAAFNRQRPIDRYIVDFLCKELKLIIEVDGSIHDIESVYKKDIIRQKKLESLGFHIIRFTNTEVLRDIDSVRESIRNTIIQLRESPSTT